MQISLKPGASEKGPDNTRPGMPLSPDEGIASSGVTFLLWRLYQHAWMVCLFFPLGSPDIPWFVTYSGYFVHLFVKQVF